MSDSDTMQAGRAMDAAMHAALYRIPIEWRECVQDPECGVWRDEQWLSNDADGIWHELEQHPCYIASAARADHWNVVPFYSTDMAAAWPAFVAFAEQHGARASVHFQEPILQPYGTYCAVLRGGNLIYPTMDIELYAYADTDALAICRCLLKIQAVQP